MIEKNEDLPPEGLSESENCAIAAAIRPRRMGGIVPYGKERLDRVEIAIFPKTVGYAATKEIRNGYSIRMLGEDMIFALSQCEKECVYAEGKEDRICRKSPEDQAHVKQLF